MMSHSRKERAISDELLRLLICAHGPPTYSSLASSSRGGQSQRMAAAETLPEASIEERFRIVHDHRDLVD